MGCFDDSLVEHDRGYRESCGRANLSGMADGEVEVNEISST